MVAALGSGNSDIARLFHIGSAVVVAGGLAYAALKLLTRPSYKLTYFDVRGW